MTSQMQQQLFDPKQLNLPFTIAIIKPDTVLDPQKLREVIEKIQAKFLIKNMIQRQLYKQEVSNLFYRHQKKNYFDEVVEYMTSGESCVMVLCNKEGSEPGQEQSSLEKKRNDPIEMWKKMIGPMNPQEARKVDVECLRGKYGKSIIKNEFFGSDNPVDANKQRKIFQFRIPQKAPQYVATPYKITLKSLQQFLQPPNLEHTCITERMDLIALYGPIVKWHSIQQCFCKSCVPTVREYTQKIKNTREGANKFKPLKILKQDDIEKVFQELCEKCQQHCSSFTHLVGGRQMQHVLTDTEINELIKEVNKNELIDMLSIEKGSTAKVMIQKIPIQQPTQILYNLDFFNILLQQINTDYYQRYDFTELQNLILQDRRIRISYWVASLVGKSVDRFPPITSLDSTLTKSQLSDPKSPFFTLNRTLPLPLLIKPEKIKNVPLDYPPSVVDKKKLYHMEENLKVERTLHRNVAKVTYLGGQKKGVRQAVSLLRPYNQGRHGNWDNYSSLKGTNSKAPVGGKNINSYIG